MLLVFVPYRGIYFLYRTPTKSPNTLKVFSSPIGESTFSTDEWAMDTFSGECFRPLSGNLLSLQTIEKAMTVFPRKFSSPIGESTFSTTLQRQPSTSQSSGFRPLSGNLLSLQLFAKVKKHILKVFVPYRGIYFLYPASRTPLFIRVPELFCGAKFKNCFSFSISYACAAFSLILCGAAQNSFYCRENSILPIPISYNFP